MKRLGHGVLDSIIDEFIDLKSIRAFVEVEGVEPEYVHKQLRRKIKYRKLGSTIRADMLGDAVLLKRLEIRNEGDLILTRTPKIKR